VKRLVFFVLAIAACASPLTVAEPREAGPPATGAFGDAGPLEGGEGVDSGFLGDPIDAADEG